MREPERLAGRNADASDRRTRGPVVPLEFQRRVAKERRGLSIVEVPGGHLVALSHPAELVDRLLDPAD